VVREPFRPPQEGEDGPEVEAQKDPDQLIYWRKKSCKCSEVLVPESVPPTFILGAHVSCQSAAQRATSLAPSLAVHVSPDLFFL
jgi:hypothetical protein